MTLFIIRDGAITLDQTCVSGIVMGSTRLQMAHRVCVTNLIPSDLSNVM